MSCPCPCFLQYYLCFDAVAHLEVCPPGTVWSQNTADCDWPGNVDTSHCRLPKSNSSSKRHSQPVEGPQTTREGKAADKLITKSKDGSAREDSYKSNHHHESMLLSRENYSNPVQEPERLSTVKFAIDVLAFSEKPIKVSKGIYEHKDTAPSSIKTKSNKRASKNRNISTGNLRKKTKS